MGDRGDVRFRFLRPESRPACPPRGDEDPLVTERVVAAMRLTGETGDGAPTRAWSVGTGDIGGGSGRRGIHDDQLPDDLAWREPVGMGDAVDGKAAGPRQLGGVPR